MHLQFSRNITAVPNKVSMTLPSVLRHPVPELLSYSSAEEEGYLRHSDILWAPLQTIPHRSLRKPLALTLWLLNSAVTLPQDWHDVDVCPEITFFFFSHPHSVLLWTNQFKNDRTMLRGFYWENKPHGWFHCHGEHHPHNLWSALELPVYESSVCKHRGEKTIKTWLYRCLRDMCVHVCVCLCMCMT